MTLKTRAEIIDWQQRLRAQPKVWSVWIMQEANGYYDSREAAEVAAEWHRQHGYRNAKAVCLGPMASLELAREQWL